MCVFRTRENWTSVGNKEEGVGERERDKGIRKEDLEKVIMPQLARSQCLSHPQVGVPHRLSTSPIISREAGQPYIWDWVCPASHVHRFSHEAENTAFFLSCWAHCFQDWEDSTMQAVPNEVISLSIYIYICYCVILCTKFFPVTSYELHSNLIHLP